MKTIPSFKDFLQLKEQAKVEENQLVIAQEEVANVAPMSQVHAEDVKGFEKIEMCKLSIEKSKAALDKLKSLISSGVKDKKVTENYLQLLEHRNRLINEYNKLINEKKQSLNK